MMIKKFLRLAPTICLALLLLVTAVSAEWQYAKAPAENKDLAIYALMADFYYPENLPDDDYDQLAYSTLLEKIISKDVGLNNSNSLLSKALEDRLEELEDDVSSNQKVSGGNLRNVFGKVVGYENVGFLIYFYSDTIYYIYTFDNRSTTKTDVRIETYLTIAEYYNGQWILKGGYKGSAVTCKYDGSTNGPYKNTIDYSTWIRDTQTN